jgi:arsenate reductase
MGKPLVLSYSGCGTCRKALAWLRNNGVEFTERPIVTEPPTLPELAQWIPASGLPVKKWLNTSGQSYRALGKAKVDAAGEDTLVKWPVVVVGKKVLVGFDEDNYAAALRIP